MERLSGCGKVRTCQNAVEWIAEVIAPNESFPAGENPQDLIWGHKELSLATSVVPPFIIIALTNLRANAAVNVHVAVMPGPGGAVAILTAPAPFDVPPLAEVRVPLAYVAEDAGERDIFVLFANEDGETFMLADRVFFPAAIPPSLWDRQSWWTVLPTLVRHEIAPGDACPADAVEAVSAVLGTPFFAINADAALPGGNDTWWGAVRPVSVIEVTEAGGVYLRIADAALLCAVAGEVQARLQRRARRFGRGVRVGKKLVSLADFARLNWKTADAREEMRKLCRLLGAEGIPVPAGWDVVVAALARVETFDQLPAADRAAFEHLLDALDAVLEGVEEG